MQVFANNAYSSLGASLSNSATSLTLATATGIRFPSPTGGSYFLLTLVGLDSNGNENAWEIVKVTGRASDALTIVRAQESTTAVAWAAGTRVELRATAGTFSSYATLAAPTFTGGITVSSGGASITGDTSVTGTLSATGTIYSSTRGTSAGFQLPDWLVYNTSSGNALAFNNGSDRMILDTSGNLLVGTTNATVGTAVGGRWVEDGTGARGSRLELGSSASTDSSIGFDMYSAGAGAYRFYVGYGGTIFATSTSISAISDISLKENIRELDTGLSEVMRLKPRRFDWKNGDGANVAGFIAQELEEVLPELVYDYQYNADTTKKSIKMGDILPTLVKAVQELNEKVDKLEAEKVSLLLTLKSVEGIEARLAALEAA